MLIDSHAHITFKEYENDLEDVIKRSFVSDTQIINVSNNYETSVKAVELAEKHEGMWAVIGCHPDDLNQEELDLEKYKQLAQSSKKVVGVGEVGLDFFRLIDENSKVKTEQVKYFKEFINLAQELDLALVLHCRGEAKDPYGSYAEMLEIINTKLTAQRPKLQGVIHCFGGTLEQAGKFLDLGFYIGFTGIVTFKNAKDIQQIAKETPLDRILIETDAPFLAPDPFRGQRNEPSYVTYVCKKIADLKGLNFEEVAKATYENTCRLFKL
jgi:TatD DNase family protein